MVVKKELELGIVTSRFRKPTATIYISRGSLGKIEESSTEKYLHIIHEDVVVTLEQKTVELYYQRLPFPPRGVRYYTFDDVFLEQIQVQSIYCFVQEQFLPAEGLDLKMAGYTYYNYGSDWIALGSSSV